MCDFRKMEIIVEPKPSPSYSYCLILGQISASRPIWRMFVCSQHELYHNIHAPGPTSRCSDHTSTALFVHTSAPPSSAPVALCCPPHCPRNCRKEEGTDLRHTSVNIAQSAHYSASPQASNLDFVCWLLLHYCLVYLPLPTSPLQSHITGKFQWRWQNGEFQCLYFILTSEKPVTKNHISSSKAYTAYCAVNVASPGVPFPGVHSSTFLRFTEEMITLEGLGREVATKRNNNRAECNYSFTWQSKIMTH